MLACMHMRLGWFGLTLTLTMGLGCGSETRSQTQPPANFGDATTDVGPKKDSAGTDTFLADTFLADGAGDGLLADASDVMMDAPDCVTGKTCIGADMPTWKLEDFQPKSTGFKKIHGLEGFKGR